MSTQFENLEILRTKQQKQVLKGIIQSLTFQSKEIEILISTIHLLNTKDMPRYLHFFQNYQGWNKDLINMFKSIEE